MFHDRFVLISCPLLLHMVAWVQPQPPVYLTAMHGDASFVLSEVLLGLFAHWRPLCTPICRWELACSRLNERHTNEVAYARIKGDTFCLCGAVGGVKSRLHLHLVFVGASCKIKVAHCALSSTYAYVCGRDWPYNVVMISFQCVFGSLPLRADGL